MEEFLWVEKYRPETVDDVILPDRLKDQFLGFIEKGDIPNMVLVGIHGVGKTTIAKALCKQMNRDVMVVNSSMHGKDTLRNEIADFATSMSLTGAGRKIVILDEIDGMSTPAQQALRGFIEEFSKNCGFIMTANQKHKIFPALISRCPVIEFAFTKSEKKDQLLEVTKRLCYILDQEGVEYDKKVILQVANKYYPDTRAAIGVLQNASSGGKIDESALVSFTEASFKKLIESMKKKSYDGIRSWVTDCEVDQGEVYTKFYEVGRDFVQEKDLPALAVLLAEYQYKAAFAMNPEINLTAALCDIAASVNWRE